MHKMKANVGKEGTVRDVVPKVFLSCATPKTLTSTGPRWGVAPTGSIPARRARRAAWPVRTSLEALRNSLDSAERARSWHAFDAPGLIDHTFFLTGNRRNDDFRTPRLVHSNMP